MGKMNHCPIGNENWKENCMRVLLMGILEQSTLLLWPRSGCEVAPLVVRRCRHLCQVNKSYVLVSRLYLQKDFASAILIVLDYIKRYEGECCQKSRVQYNYAFRFDGRFSSLFLHCNLWCQAELESQHCLHQSSSSTTPFCDVFTLLISRAIALYKHRISNSPSVCIEYTQVYLSLWDSQQKTFPISIMPFHWTLAPFSLPFEGQNNLVRNCVMIIVGPFIITNQCLFSLLFTPKAISPKANCHFSVTCSYTYLFFT